jgi:hypothetical protein
VSGRGREIRSHSVVNTKEIKVRVPGAVTLAAAKYSLRAHEVVCDVVHSWVRERDVADRRRASNSGGRRQHSSHDCAFSMPWYCVSFQLLAYAFGQTTRSPGTLFCWNRHMPFPFLWTGERKNLDADLIGWLCCETLSAGQTLLLCLSRSQQLTSRWETDHRCRWRISLYSIMNCMITTGVYSTYLRAYIHGRNLVLIKQPTAHIQSRISIQLFWGLPFLLLVGFISAP